MISVLIFCSSQGYLEYKPTTPFQKKLPDLERPDNPNNNRENIRSSDLPDETIYVNPDSQRESYIYKPGNAFRLVVTKDKYPDILPDKSVYGVITLKVTSDYKATSRVIYSKKNYRFDRLSWAIRTGWNETIPFFSKLKGFSKYLKPFNTPVYAHFYINGVKEYPEYPGQFYHWPREALEDYYLYILQKIDAVASQN